MLIGKRLHSSLFGGNILRVTLMRQLVGGKLPKKKDVELMAAMDTLSSQSFDSFYSKISTKYQDTSQNISFKTTLRLVSDSAMTMTITYARIPFVNALITADSIKVTNKKDKCYTKESLSFIKEKFSVDFSLKNIEELMMGLPVDFDPERKYYQIDSENGYELCTHSKRDLKKLEKGELSEIVMFYTLSPDLKQLTSMTIVSPKDKTEIRVDYKTRELIETYLFPKLVDISITTPAQEIKIEMEYKKSRINNTEQIHFVIPDSYGKCK
jgi:hypothetical protein